MQNVNLYQVQRRQRGGPRVQHMLAVAMAAGLLATLHLGWHLWQVQSLKARLVMADRAAAAEQALLDEEQGRFREPQADPQLPGQVASAQFRNQRLQRLAEHLRLLAAQHQRGFADVLDALAEQHPAKGLWLTRIELEDGGQQVRLEGLSLDQGQLPAYLQALGQAPVFAGREFAHFSAAREQQQPFSFVLASRQPAPEATR